MTQLLVPSNLTLPVGPPQLHFTPPPRFSTTSFENYAPQHPSQSAARDTVREFAIAAPRPPAAGSWLHWRPRHRPQPGSGLYLDGGFGVGKTHLLAAAYHESGSVKTYLSFQELVYSIGVLGITGAQEAFRDSRLLCLDEFELDDPGNTLMVKAFLAAAFARGTAVITTSNTPPEAQGQGRFNAEDFKREIQSIAERFTVLRLEGPDYRHRTQAGAPLSQQEFAALLACETRLPVIHLEWLELLALLSRYHPIRYGELLRQVGSVYLANLTPLKDQNSALRFVHFVDKLYDLKLGLRISGDIPISELFDASYRHSAYAAKHFRCLSRLLELLGEGRQ